MSTPVIMLLLLLSPYGFVRMRSALTHRPGDLRGAAALGLAALFAFTGTGHFTHTEQMSQMLPSWFPMRVPFVYATGILELAIAAGFLVPASRRLTGWVAAAMLLLFFPAYVYAALHRVQMAGYEWGPAYLFVRAPLQIIIFAWIYWFTIRAIAAPHGGEQPLEKNIPRR